MFKLIGIATAVILFPQTILAQDALCYIEWQGETIDLSSSICNSNRTENPPLLNQETVTRPEVISLKDIRFSDVMVTPTTDENLVEVSGTITNESNLVGVVPIIKLNIIDRRNKQLIGSTSVSIEADSGIAPGDQMSFIQTIDTNSFNSTVPLSELDVEVVDSH